MLLASLAVGHTPIGSIQDNIFCNEFFSSAKPDVSPFFEYFCGSDRSLAAFDGEMQLDVPGVAFFGSLRMIHRRSAETIAHCSCLSLAPPETLRRVCLPYGNFQAVAAVSIPANGQIAIIPLTPDQAVDPSRGLDVPATRSESALLTISSIIKMRSAKA